MVALWVVNTDNDWFDFLSNQSDVEEVNFWQPSGGNEFRAVSPGELFVFRLKSPRNKIGGFGVFSHSSKLPISVAWDTFGRNNGVSSLLEMRSKIARYNHVDTIPADFLIGCRILTQPVFLDRSRWFDLPASWSRSIVVGKTYDTDTTEGMALWDKLQDAIQYDVSGSARYVHEVSEDAPRFGKPALIVPRLGQGAFRISVMDAYQRKCAVSGGKVLPALEAAHIRPFADGGSHDVSNGILLRRDIHSVFDVGYVTIDPDLRFVVSDRVKQDFNNGHEYYRLHGASVEVPGISRLCPDKQLLTWHNENVFRN